VIWKKVKAVAKTRANERILDYLKTKDVYSKAAYSKAARRVLC